jgi:hypothetical protein
MPKKAVANWKNLKQQYIFARLRGQLSSSPKLSLKEFAEKAGVGYDLLRQHASMDDWDGEVRALEKKQDKDYILGLNLIVKKGIEKISDEFAKQELAIRKRHAFFAQAMQDKAITAIMHVDPLKMSVGDALKMMELGISEERLAMGLPDQISSHLITPGSGTGETPEDHIKLQNKLKGLATEFLEFIEGDFTHVPG